MKIRAGIDPGKDGFIAIQSISGEGTAISYHPMPELGDHINLQELNGIISGLAGEDTFVALEQVHAIRGSSAKATWEFSRAVAVVEMALIANKIPHQLVPPKKWQAELFAGVPVSKKPSSTGKTEVNDTKSMAAMSAQRLFPNEDLRATTRSRVLHNGKVDALLISEYCRRKFNGRD